MRHGSDSVRSVGFRWCVQPRRESARKDRTGTARFLGSHSTSKTQAWEETRYMYTHATCYAHATHLPRPRARALRPLPSRTPSVAEGVLFLQSPTGLKGGYTEL